MTKIYNIEYLDSQGLVTSQAYYTSLKGLYDNEKERLQCSLSFLQKKFWENKAMLNGTEIESSTVTVQKKDVYWRIIQSFAQPA
jgi:hypothetical protein